LNSEAKYKKYKIKQKKIKEKLKMQKEIKIEKALML